MARVLEEGPSPEAFPVTPGGVKQGCVLAPTLFSVMLTVDVESDAF